MSVRDARGDGRRYRRFALAGPTKLHAMPCNVRFRDGCQAIYATVKIIKQTGNAKLDTHTKKKQQKKIENSFHTRTEWAGKREEINGGIHFISLFEILLK